MSYYNTNPMYQQQPRFLSGRGGVSNFKAINVSSNIDDITVALAGSSKKVKSSKRRYITSGIIPEVNGITDYSEYKKFIINLLVERGNVRVNEAEKFTDKDVMPNFIKAVSHDSVNYEDRSDNYEIYEHLGDATINKSATWYLKCRFPEIIKRGDTGVQIIATQKMLIVSKPYLSKFCDKIGLSKFIRYRPLEYVFLKEGVTHSDKVNVKKINLDRSMREDVFEAFFGCLEEVIDYKEGFVGVGYSVVFKILSSIFNEESIPTTKNLLVNAKSQLKEIFDARSKFGDKIVYENVDVGGKTTKILKVILKEPEQVELKFGPISLTSATFEDDDYDISIKIVEQQLAKEALKYLQSKYGPVFSRFKPDE